MFKNVYSLVNIHLNMVPKRYQVMYKISGNSLTSLLATTQGPRVIFHKNPFSLRTILRPQVPLIKFFLDFRPQLPITKYQLWLDKFLKKNPSTEISSEIKEHTFKFPQVEANKRHSQNLLIENISITFLAILSLSHRPADQAQAHPHSLTEHADGNDN